MYVSSLKDNDRSQNGHCNHQREDSNLPNGRRSRQVRHRQYCQCSTQRSNARSRTSSPSTSTFPSPLHNASDPSHDTHVCSKIDSDVINLSYKHAGYNSASKKIRGEHRHTRCQTSTRQAKERTKYHRLLQRKAKQGNYAASLSLSLKREQVIWCFRAFRWAKQHSVACVVASQSHR